MVQSPIVLLVADEPDTVRLVRKSLQADGCQILEASDGEQVLAIYQQTQADLILLDIILPRRDGEEIAGPDEIVIGPRTRNWPACTCSSTRSAPCASGDGVSQLLYNVPGRLAL